MSFSNRCPTCTPLDGVGSLAYMARIFFGKVGHSPRPGDEAPAHQLEVATLGPAMHVLRFIWQKIAPAELRTSDLRLASNQCYH
jgi:hypothetical protein